MAAYLALKCESNIGRRDATQRSLPPVDSGESQTRGQSPAWRCCILSGLNLPTEYRSRRASLKADSLSLGYGGITLYPLSSLEENQVGYSVTEDGKPITEEEAGGWKASWVVIGNEQTCGDPIILDTSSGAILTAMHGEGDWQAESISPSIGAFFAGLEAFEELAQGRENPVALENKPITPEEAERFLATVKSLNGSSEELDFWQILIEIDPDE